MSELLIGLVSGAFGLMGVVIGAWLATREARRREAREAERRLLVAVRLVKDELVEAASMLQSKAPAHVSYAYQSLECRNWQQYREDLAAILNPGQWDEVSDVFFRIEGCRRLIELRNQWPLPGEGAELAMRCGDDAFDALVSLPSEHPTASRRDDRKYTWNVRRKQLRHPVHTYRNRRYWKKRQAERASEPPVA